jgi:phage-related minor tail protein
MVDEEELVVGVRADSAAFRRDVEELRASLEGPLSAGAERAGRAIETTLARAVRTGSVGFEDLRRVALSVLGEIAAAAVQGGIGSLLGGGKGAPAGASPVTGIASALAGVLSGSPGRATGGPVASGRAYLVGERGPEWFVPTASGRVEVPAATPAGREVRVAITINAPPGDGAEVMGRSSRQVARAVKAALAQE